MPMEDLYQKRSKKKSGARLAAWLMVTFMALWLIGLIYMTVFMDMPVVILVFYSIIPIGVIVGVLLALRQRIHEIDGGEEDEAIHY